MNEHDLRRWIQPILCRMLCGLFLVATAVNSAQAQESPFNGVWQTQDGDLIALVEFDDQIIGFVLGNGLEGLQGLNDLRDLGGDLGWGLVFGQHSKDEIEAFGFGGLGIKAIHSKGVLKGRLLSNRLEGGRQFEATRIFTISESLFNGLWQLEYANGDRTFLITAVVEIFGIKSTFMLELDESLNVFPDVYYDFGLFGFLTDSGFFRATGLLEKKGTLSGRFEEDLIEGAYSTGLFQPRLQFKGVRIF